MSPFLAGAGRERALVRKGGGGATAQGGPRHHRRPERGRGAQPPAFEQPADVRMLHAVIGQ